MAWRYYLAPVIGAATEQDPRRSVLRDWVFARKGRHCKTLLDGLRVPNPDRRTWSLCEVRDAGDGDWSTLDADSSVALLAAEGSRLNQVPDATLDAALTKFGLARDGSDTSVRSVIRRIGRTFQSNYDVVR